MKVSFIVATLLAVGSSTVGAMPSYRDSEIIRIKSHLYKQIEKLVFEEDNEDRKCHEHYNQLQCCKDFNEYEDDEGKKFFRGRECWFIHPGQSCKEIGMGDHKKTCCKACTRTIPSFCFGCSKPE